MNAISEIAVLLRNGKSVRQSAELNGLPITRIETIADGTINPAKVGFADLEESDCTDWLLQDGDILISHINSTKHLGKCAIYQGDPPALIHGMNLLALRVEPDIAASRYVYWMLSSTGFRRKLPRITKDSVNQSSFNISSFRKLEIPLPPLPEQKRIAGILDAADALRAKRREALAQLDTLLQSTFLDMFGDPVTNPMGWTKVKSGELFLLPPKIGTITPAAGRGYLVVRVGEVGESRIAFERCGRVEISEKDFAKFRLERGDTVIARAIGSKNHLGKASFFADFDEATVIDSHVMRLRPDPIKCDGLWFYSLISSDRGKALLQQTGGATAVQFNINAKQASSVQVALPPLDLQHHFAAVAESVERQKARQRAHLAELDTLFASLQSRAFRGDL